MTSRITEDAFGAMQYTIAVVFVYGVAVLGVFGLSHYSRQKRRRNGDNETDEFLKNYDEVRRVWEQRSRVGVVCQLLHSLHSQPGDSPSLQVHRPVLPSVNSLAFLPISFSQVNEERVPSVTDGQTSFEGQLLMVEPQDNKDPRTGTILGSSRRTYTTCRKCKTTFDPLAPFNKDCACLVLTEARVVEKLNMLPLGTKVADERRKSETMSCQEKRMSFKNLTLARKCSDGNTRDMDQTLV
ncbi:hypothetical protein DPMN_085208 [Dreissena polymorpha]|uniref:Transmembrane protein n=1 Tax=Dreissena polymorpha TaxID=45954 RepID=A0A9D4BCN6_DREPO|nr:hypothetical protein DPMN_085208 [Dreissena polymorpha]